MKRRCCLNVLEDGIIKPKGYRFTSEFRYQTNFIKAIAFLTPLVVGPLFILATDKVFLPLTRGQLDIVVIFTIFSPSWIRAIIQGGVSLLLGYSLSLSSLLALRFVADFPMKTGGYRPYRDAFIVAIAPLSFYIALLIPLLLGHQGTIGNMLTFVLLMNLLPTAADVYFVGWLLTKSRASLLYMNPRSAFLFEPLLEDDKATSRIEGQVSEQPKKRKHRKSRRSYSLSSRRMI